MKTGVAGKAITHERGSRLPGGELFVFSFAHILDECVDLVFAEVGKAVHSSAALPNAIFDLFLGHAISYAYQRRKQRRRTFQIVAMANRALTLINALSAQPAGGVLGQFDGPGHFVGVDVENSRVRVERRATPLCSSIKAGENDGVLSRA